MKRDEVVKRALAQIKSVADLCMQCGVCTASCPNSHAMDLTPRLMWRLIQIGHVDDVLESKTFWMCSTCYACTLNCSRGLPLTETIGALKRVASRSPSHAHSSNFYRAFIDNIRRYGRVQETRLMMSYLTATGELLAPFRFMRLGLKLLGKNKVHLGAWSEGKGKLEAMFAKAAELEEAR